MKALLHVIYVVLILSFACCVEKTPEYDKRLVEAHKLLRTNADSTLKLLRELDLNEFKTQRDRAYYALCYTQVYYWLDVHVTNDSLIKIAVDYYSEHGDSIERSKTCFFAAKVYESMGNRDEAMQYFNNAIKLAPFNDINLKLQIYTHKAFMINNDSPDEDALNMYDEIKELAKLAGDTSSVFNALGQQGFNYLYNKNYTMAIARYNEALDLADRYTAYDLKFTPLNRLAQCYAESGDIEKAVHYVTEAEKHVVSESDKLYLYYTLGTVYIKLKDWSKAERYVKMAADTGDVLGKLMYYGQLRDLYSGKGELKKYAENNVLYNKYYDLYHSNIRNNNSAKSNIKQKHAEKERENAILAEKSRRMNWLVLAVVLLVVSSGIGVVMKIRRMKSQSQKQKEKHDAELKETNLRHMELKEHFFEMNEVVKKVNEIKKTKNGALQDRQLRFGDDELKTLEQELDLCYGNVISKIKERHGKMKKEETAICCLICMKLPSSKIALILGMNEDAVRQRKSRLKRDKFGLDDSASLNDYVLSFISHE